MDTTLTPWWRTRTLVRLAAAVVPLALCAVLYGIRDAVPAATAVLVLCIVAAAATGDRAAGLLAAVSSGLWFDVFLTEPYLRLAVEDGDDIQAAVLDHDGVLTQGGHHRDVDRTGLPTDEYVALVVRRATRVVGHFLVTASTRVARPSREQCRVAVLLADQVAPLVEA